MCDFKSLLHPLSLGQSLSQPDARLAFEHLLSGEVSPAQAGAFLMGLRVKGETVPEITGAVEALRAKMIKVEAPAHAIDIVGTGGDHSGSYNVSTLAALIVAGCGVPVAKHGNRAASSRSGAADVLGALGVKLGLTPAHLAECLKEAGFCFMFAQAHHGSMRHIAPIRGELGIRTIFNLIGPLSNPAGVKRMLLGVSSLEWLEPLVKVLQALGMEKVWAVYGDGLDEMTTTGPTHVMALEQGHIRSFIFDPRDAGMPLATLDQLKGGDPEHNAKALRDVLEGLKTPYRDIAVLNAAAALVVADYAKDIQDGVKQAQTCINEGRALNVLEKLIDVSNKM